jgi:gamma-glutamyltranspeptidase/glutathione hydrolase
MKHIVSLILVCTLFTGALSHASENKAAVAMPDKFSADAAEQILKSGGNAVDAAVAAQFVLAVTLPEAGNIGGGGLMTLWFDGKPDFLDYREMAPAKAHRDLYLDENGEVIENLSIYGALASGVPGSVAGMWEAHKKYGTLPWEMLLEPAIKLARDGFIVPEKLGNMVIEHIAELESDNIDVNFAEHFSAMKSYQLFIQTDLAESLIRIQKQGRDGFYKGETARLITKFMTENDGLITQEDLENYVAKWRTPIVKPWREYQIVTAPPPSSGGIAIVQWLSMFDYLKPASSMSPTSAEYLHLLSEIGKRVFADRAEYLGDPDYYDVPVKSLVNENYMQSRTAGIVMNKITETSGVAPGGFESEDTTHFSIVDAQGNAVSNTTTINLSFGSSVVVEGAGFLLNDEMDDFSSKPGIANYFGALGGNANAIEPGKRMLSSMTPTILVKDNVPAVVTGSPGGTTIISSVYLSILSLVEHQLSAEQTVNLPRFHHQLYPKNKIRAHPGFEDKDVKKLESLGYEFDHRRFGDLHVISTIGGKLDAASEASGRGKAKVFSVH